MAGTKFQFLENALLGAALGGGSFVPAATLFLRLYTTAPTSSGGGVEVAGGAYASVGHANNVTTWPAPSGTPALLQNGVAFTFPTATVAWGSVVAWGLFDAASSGNGYYWGLLNTPKTVGVGDTPSFAIGSLTVTET